MTKFTLNENNDIQLILLNGFRNRTTNYGEIFLLAKYYIWTCGYSKQKTINFIIDFCQCQDRNFNFIQDRKMVKSAVNRALKSDIKNIGKISISLNEIEAIEKIGNFKYQKIAFIILVLAKIKYTGNTVDYYISRDLDREIIRLSGLRITHKEFERIHKILCDEGFIEPSRPGYKQYNTDKLLFVDNSGEIAVEITEFENDNSIISKYLDYYGGEMMWCMVCGKLVPKRSNRQKRCVDCWLNNRY